MPPSKSHKNGPTMEKLSEDWWRWAIQLPSGDGNNPFEDLTGDAARAGNVGDHTFFLAGFAGNSEDPDPKVSRATREFAVPEKATIIVPVLNTMESVPDYNFYNHTTGDTSEQVENYIDNWKDHYVQSVFLEVDGKPVSLDDKYVKTDFFSLPSVKEGELGYDQFGLRPEGAKQQPSMAGGYWAELDLGVGDHIIHFGGVLDYQNSAGVFGQPDGIPDFTIDVTDIIHVVSESQYKNGAVSFTDPDSLNWRGASTGIDDITLGF